MRCASGAIFKTIVRFGYFQGPGLRVCLIIWSNISILCMYFELCTLSVVRAGV